MKYVLDTSAYSAFNRGDERLKRWFAVDHDIIVPITVIGELRCGFAAGAKQSINEDMLRRFLDMTNVDVAASALATTESLASLYAKLRKAGTPIGANDMWIAALCLEHDLPLLTTDTDFASVKDLNVLPLS